MALQLENAALELSDTRALALFRCMLLSRRLDERMWALNRQGKTPFIVSSAGHEAVQVATGFALDPEVDWALPYYRDAGLALAWGMSARDLLLGAFAKADDPNSGGRQMPNHWSLRSRRIFGHSSPIATQFPHAAGIAHGLRLQGRPGVVLVSGGEGATSAGDWHEAMNYAAIHRLPLITLIENNHYAISVPEREQVAGDIAVRAKGYGMFGVRIDGNDVAEVYSTISEAAARARAGDGPSLIEAVTYRYFGHTSDDDDRVYRKPEEVEQWRKRDPIILFRQALMEARLLSEQDEARLEEEVGREIAEAVDSALAAADPTDATSNVYARSIEPATAVTQPEPAPEGEEVNLITAINRTLHEVLAARTNSYVFGEDVADPKGGVFKATAGLGDRFGVDRCFNAPLAESLIVGVAIGMGATELVPLPEIQFADFIHPAFNQIVSEAARLNYRTNGEWNCPIVIRAPYGGGIHGALYHSQSIEAFYAHVPGLKVVVPSTPADAKGLLWKAVDDPDPVIFLEPKKLYRLVKGPFPAGEHRVPLGKAAIRRSGEHLTLIAYGAMAYFAGEACELLDGEGISVELIDLRSLRPLDWPTIEASVRKTGKVLVVHEDNGFGGFGAEIAAMVADRTFEWLDAPVRRYTTPEVPTFPFNKDLEASLMPSVDGMVEWARELHRY